MIGDLVTGRVAESTGQAFNTPYDEGDGAGKFKFLSEVLRWRAQTQPDNMLYSLLDNKVGINGQPMCAAPPTLHAPAAPRCSEVQIKRFR